MGDSGAASWRWDSVRGKRVEVLQNAPLKDPIKYKVMEYEVSLRRSEAR